MNAHFRFHQFQFKFPAGTSRGVLLEKPSCFLFIEEGGRTGIGECSTIPGLSPDDSESYAATMSALCAHIEQGLPIGEFNLDAFPSIAFGLETALLDLQSLSTQVLFPSSFTEGKAGIPINGLIWMGEPAFMLEQIGRKLDEGYRCLKMKVGALDFESELQILKHIRSRFSSRDLELRVDANGGFTPVDAMQKLVELSQYTIHSIEQPIAPGQWDDMAELCSKSPIPIALDEELISYPAEQAMALLQRIQPHYIILKPSLIGGIAVSEQWIAAAEAMKVGWWVTSALESNVGLNAIAQWTYTLQNAMPQGLGTGQLYHNNMESPLRIEDAQLWFDPELSVDINALS